MDNLTTFLDKTKNEYSDKIAVNFDNIEKITYKQLFNEICRFTSGLRKLGYQPGDRIAISLANSTEFVISFFGVVRAGMIAIPLNTMLQKPELEYQLSDSGARCLIPNKRTAKIFKLIPEENTSVRHIIKPIRDAENKLEWEGISLDSTSNCEPSEVSFDTVAMLIYTAGMDGFSKGAMLTHKSVAANLEMSIIALGACESDYFIASIPLFHSFGLVANCLVPLAKGAKVFLQSHFNPKNFINTLQENKITILNAVPTLLATLINYEEFNPSFFQSMRLVVSGGAALSKKLALKYEETGIELKQGYGLTECSPAVSMNPIYGPNKYESIGIPLKGVQLRIVNEQNIDVKTGEIGELLVKGDLVMKGYWNDKVLTDKTIDNDWLHTGDLAKCDEEGYYFLTGRKKSLIIVGGFNVYPKEVSRLLCMHPDINDTEISSVPDPIQGEVVKAKIYLKKGSSLTIRDVSHFAMKVMSIYKIPRVIEIKEIT